MQIPCVQPACDPLQVGLPAAMSSVHTGASGNRASGSSPRYLQLLTPVSRNPLIRIAPERWPSCVKPPSSCSHHLPAHLRNAQIIRCGEHVKVSRGLRAGSSSVDAYRTSTHRAWRTGDEVRATSHRPCRLVAQISADLLSAFDACTCCDRTPYAFCIGPGRVPSDGLRPGTRLGGGSIPCCVERHEVHT